MIILLKEKFIGNQRKPIINLIYDETVATPPLVKILSKYSNSFKKEFTNIEINSLNEVNLMKDFIYILPIETIEKSLSVENIRDHLDKFANKQFPKNIVLDYTNEGPSFNDEFIAKLEALVGKLESNFPKHFFIFAQGNENLELISPKLQRAKNFRIMKCNSWILNRGETFYSKSIPTPSKDEIIEPRRFLMLNYWPRPHRVFAVEHIFRNNLLKHFHLSFSGRNIPESNIDFFEDAILHANKFGIENNAIRESLIKMENKLPLKLDLLKIEKRNNPSLLESSDSTDKYRYSCKIEIVSETEFDEGYGELRLTEKTLKPINAGKPFIILGPSRALKVLQELGFESFGTLWNESYDDIGLLRIRFQKFTSLIDSLSSMDTNDFEKIVYEAERIAKKNAIYLHSEQFERIAFQRYLVPILKLLS